MMPPNRCRLCHLDSPQQCSLRAAERNPCALPFTKAQKASISNTFHESLTDLSLLLPAAVISPHLSGAGCEWGIAERVRAGGEPSPPGLGWFLHALRGAGLA